MTTIPTVTGEVEAGKLGMTLPHEHLIARREIAWSQFPHLYNEAAMLESVVVAIRKAMALGVRTFFDATLAGTGRDVRFLKRAAEATGLQIVAATGMYAFDVLPTTFEGRDVDYLAEALVHDIETGIQGTAIRAGFIKATTDRPGVTPGVEKSLRASARAHVRTGAPIMTHAWTGNRSGLMQLDIFEQEGADLGRVVIGHSGDTDDMDYLQRVLDRGAWLGLDRYGLEDLLSTERRNVTVIRLCEMGYTDRLLLSHDHVTFYDSYFPTDEVRRLRSRASYTYIFENVLPPLRSAGISEAQIETMMVRNPARWISGLEL